MNPASSLLHVVVLLLRLVLPIMAIRLRLDPGHPYAVQRAQFVLQELQELSDTDIYNTLSLKRISDAATREGVFHSNTFLTLELSSPYFSSGRKEEWFEVVVMEHKEDGHISFAINSFPEMDSGAMEDFYMQKVEKQQQARDAVFASLDLEAEGRTRAMESKGTSNPAALAVTLMADNANHLLHLAQFGAYAEEDVLRAAVNGELDRRWEQSTGGQLAALGSSKLQEIVSDTAVSAQFRRLAKEELEHRVRVV